MGNILLEHTDEINNSTNGGIHLNYRNSGNVSLCVGGGNVGIGTISPTYKLDVAGNIRATGQIIREGSGQTWVNGRNGALLRETSVAGYHTLWSLKTTNGSWDFGEYNAGNDWDNIPVLSYITDSNYNSGNNTPTYQIRFPLASGTVALTSQIPNPNNYYWAYDNKYIKQPICLEFVTFVSYRLTQSIWSSPTYTNESGNITRLTIPNLTVPYNYEVYALVISQSNPNTYATIMTTTPLEVKITHRESSSGHFAVMIWAIPS